MNFFDKYSILISPFHCSQWRGSENDQINAYSRTLITKSFIFSSAVIAYVNGGMSEDQASVASVQRSFNEDFVPIDVSYEALRILINGLGSAEGCDPTTMQIIRAGILNEERFNEAIRQIKRLRQQLNI